MRLSPEDIIEAAIDPLAVYFGERVGALRFDRLSPGSLLLDFGDAGLFRLEVVNVE